MTMRPHPAAPEANFLPLVEFGRAAGALVFGSLSALRWRLGGKPAESQSPADGRSFNTGGGRGDGPPDLDELWRDFNNKLSGLFGGKGGSGGPRREGGNGGGGGGNFQPDMKSAGIGAGLIAGVVVLIWLASGFFIVQEEIGRAHV